MIHSNYFLALQEHPVECSSTAVQVAPAAAPVMPSALYPIDKLANIFSAPRTVLEPFIAVVFQLSGLQKTPFVTIARAPYEGFCGLLDISFQSDLNCYFPIY